MASNSSAQPIQASAVVLIGHLDLDHYVNIDSPLTPGSDTSLASHKEGSLWDKNEDIYQDDPSSPLTPPSTYDYDRKLGTDSSIFALPDSDPVIDRQLSTTKLPTTKPVDTERDTRINTEPEKKLPGWLFGQLDIPGLYTKSLDGENRWQSETPGGATRPQTRFPIDLNFSAAASKSRTDSAVNSSPRAGRSNLRPGRHNVEPVIPLTSSELPVPDEKIGSKSTNSSPSKNCSSGNRRSNILETTSSASRDLRERLLKILPLNTREQLREDPRRCVASTIKPGHPRCKHKTGGSFKVTDRFPNSLTASITDSLNDESLTLVRDLITSALCGTTHRKSRSFQFKDICRDLDNMSDNDRTTFDDWIEILAREPQSTKEEPLSSYDEEVSLLRRSSKAAQSEKATANPSASSRPVTRSLTRSSPPKSRSATTPLIDTTIGPQPTYFQDFVLEQPEHAAKRSTRNVLRELLTKPLNSSKLTNGYIYMYWFPGNFGHVKIGYTCRDPATRLKEWEKKCKHAVDSFDMPLVAVPHVYRIEALIHAELKDVRCRERSCRGCGKDHIEWFRVEPKHARRVFDKWAEWMKTEPYAFVGGESGTGWKLKQDIPEEKIKELCQPLERSVEALTKTRISGPRRKSGRRRY